MQLSRFPAIEECIEAFRRLPGVGPKSAQRIVFHLLGKDPEAAGKIAASCEALHERVGLCGTCSMLVEGEAGGSDCAVCGARDASVICVVEEPADVFAVERAVLERAFREMKPKLAPDGMLWASWPKKAAKVPSDLDENVVRRIGLDQGLVEVKVAAVDEVWSGLKFVYRLKDRSGV